MDERLQRLLRRYKGPDLGDAELRQHLFAGLVRGNHLPESVVRFVDSLGPESELSLAWYPDERPRPDDSDDDDSDDVASGWSLFVRERARGRQQAERSKSAKKAWLARRSRERDARRGARRRRKRKKKLLDPTRFPLPLNITPILFSYDETTVEDRRDDEGEDVGREENLFRNRRQLELENLRIRFFRDLLNRDFHRFILHFLSDFYLNLYHRLDRGVLIDIVRRYIILHQDEDAEMAEEANADFVHLDLNDVNAAVDKYLQQLKHAIKSLPRLLELTNLTSSDAPPTWYDEIIGFLTDPDFRVRIEGYPESFGEEEEAPPGGSGGISIHHEQDRPPNLPPMTSDILCMEQSLLGLFNSLHHLYDLGFSGGAPPALSEEYDTDFERPPGSSLPRLDALPGTFGRDSIDLLLPDEWEDEAYVMRFQLFDPLPEDPIDQGSDPVSPDLAIGYSNALAGGVIALIAPELCDAHNQLKEQNVEKINADGWDLEREIREEVTTGPELQSLGAQFDRVFQTAEAEIADFDAELEQGVNITNANIAQLRATIGALHTSSNTFAEQRRQLGDAAIAASSQIKDQASRYHDARIGLLDSIDQLHNSAYTRILPFLQGIAMDAVIFNLETL